MSRLPRNWHSRGYLPHFDRPGLVQFITFRLADSIPTDILTRWKQEVALAEVSGRDTVAIGSLREYHRRVEACLDAGHGACHLRLPANACIVEDALLCFDAIRYRLLEWVVMPNHVHVLVEQVSGYRLEDILHSWKSFSAKQINRMLSRKGQLWQEEYFDRYIRDRRHLHEVIDYIRRNPVDAGLVPSPEAWSFGSAGITPGRTQAF